MLPAVSYEVTYIDQVNEGVYVVWATHDEYIETEALARGQALETSSRTQYKNARVVKVTREVIGSYVDGKEEPK